MMQEQPKGEELLSCARDYLKQSILPHVEGEQKHGVLMVMNAMAIARRQFLSGMSSESEELKVLRALVSDSRVGLLDGNRLLSNLLREGAADPNSPEREAILEHLRNVTRWRVSESNPRILGGS